MGYSKAQVIAVGAVLGPVPTIVVALRFYSRRLIRANIGTDDWLIVGALILNYGVAATLIMMAEIGALGQHQKLDSNGQQYMNDQILHYNQGNYAIQVLSIFTIGLAKLSILFLYRRLFLVSRLRTILNIYIWFIVAWILAFGLSTIFECHPIQYAWTQLESTKYFHCIDLKKYFNALSISDALTDAIIMALPLPVILRMKLPLRQKIGIAAIFVMGGGVLAISLTRLVIFMRIGSEIMFHWNEWTYYVTPTHLWTLAEGTLAVIAASLPALKPLLAGPAKQTNQEEGSYPPFPSKPAFRVEGCETDLSREGSKTTNTSRSESLNVPEFVTVAQV